MSGNIYIYVLVMAVVTYLIRLIPLTLIRKEIKNNYIKSFLYYVPFVTLAVMTFPAILYGTESMISGLAGFITALVLAYAGQSLIVVSVLSCLAVFIVELIV
ncbi:MAG: AzlD domain-containing protein [Lachnospiraceae bacterium]|nr:AzlD domain-containing protein [Lachnospiraceae bacterium]